MIDVSGYLAEVARIHATGVATELAYRPALEKLFKSITDGVTAINEPKGIKVGRPDFVFLRNVGKGTDITVGHCEAKDVGLGINPKGMNDFNKAQHERYVKALPNLIYTNALDFRFYKKGELTREISIADFQIGIQPKPDQFDVLANQLKDFAAEKLQTIESAEKLAEMMAGKAVLIKDILFNSLKEDKDVRNDLTDQYKSFKDMLIHDLSVEDFADIYAETIAYGMFGARLHDKTLKDFSRAEALDLMPKSNPFLRNLFTYVAGPNLDERIRRTIDELAEIFQATNLPKLFEDFGRFTQRNDPFIHFYETFLAEYNPAKRKARGVWYTPEPVVNFIVRAVDDVLKTEFGLALGLADTSKVTVDWETGQTRTTKSGKAEPIVLKKEVHRVQILDPAAGTGTFLAEVIKQIAPKVKDVADGQWSNYVEKELIPRLHGFELLMASYAMCHTKLEMMLLEMKYQPTAENPPRLSVYLTNSLEEGERANQQLPWANWLSEEAKQANAIKRDMPIMCVIGNPPYSGISSNKGESFKWIDGLLADYKKEPGGKERLDERKHWLDDDYVKFFRMAEKLIEKNGQGVVCFISNHGYLDNPTFRGMRWRLNQTFDKIYIVDLHGNSNKKERAPDGSADKNVFDIMPGVAIFLGVKKAVKKGENKILRRDIWGSRELKNESLWQARILVGSWEKVYPRLPNWYYFNQDEEKSKEYEAFFSLGELFETFTSGIVTARDGLVIDFTRRELSAKLGRFFDPAKSTAEIRTEFFGNKSSKKYEQGDTRGWSVVGARQGFHGKDYNSYITQLAYRPLDNQSVIYSEKMVDWPRKAAFEKIFRGANFCMLVPMGLKDDSFRHCWITNLIHEAIFLSGTTASNAMALPLYVYDNPELNSAIRHVNFNPKVHKAIVAGAKDKAHGAPDEVAIFDYIYGVLHCPAYRNTYKEFLKVDFPRVPYPPSPQVFWDVSAKGTALRKLHLMEDAAIGETPYKFTGVGDSVVGKVEYDGGVVRINKDQGFEGVPEIAWNFHIGGYQPAQKWLKDRKGRALSFDDIRHYQKIIKVLSETDRIMKTITMPLDGAK